MKKESIICLVCSAGVVSFLLTFIISLMMPFAVQPARAGSGLAARSTPPIVTTDWLAKHMKDPGLVIVDIRSDKEYLAGHIPSAVHVPMPSWIVKRNGLLLEVPEDAALFQTLGSAGIDKDSKVVVVNRANHPYPLADTARVADMLIYAGVPNASVLSGGYDKWVKEKKAVSKDPSKPTPVTYKGQTNKNMFVSKKDVQEKMGKCTLVDARTPDVYFGVVKEPFCARPGHIQGATCWPVPWMWTKEGTYKDSNALKQTAAGVMGDDPSKEIIVYCGVGGYAAAAWLVLHDVLGYQNVKIYDGSAQEWTADPSAPVSAYVWE
ncbi:MAG: sulfurtransferase [Deltaproteobacteria bacterium]|nr:sulfurtransferase [Deltaproteobacteria bacterium]